jgi:hypothetical protein
VGTLYSLVLEYQHRVLLGVLPSVSHRVSLTYSIYLFLGDSSLSKREQEMGSDGQTAGYKVVRR